jgi:uncharacterized protein YlxP (DUF503 family)
MIKNVSLALIILISGFSYAQDNNQSIDELLAKVAQNAPQMQTIELKYNIALAEAEIQKGNELLQYTFSAPSLLNTSIPNVFNDSSVELPLSLAYQHQLSRPTPNGGNIMARVSHEISAIDALNQSAPGLSQQIGVGIGISTPLFTNERSNLPLSELLAQQAEINRKIAITNFFTDFLTDWKDLSLAMVEVESLRNTIQQLERRLNDNQRLSEIGQINEIDLINIRVQLLESKNELFEKVNNLRELSAAFYSSYQITAAELGQVSDWTPSQIAAAIVSLGVQNIYDLQILLADITYLIEHRNQINPSSSSSLSISTDLFWSNSNDLANTIPELFRDSGLSSIYPVFNLSLVLSPQDRQANLLSSSIIENLKTNNTNAILQIIREAEIFIQGIEADIERLDNRLVEIIGLREEILLAAVDADEALIEEKIIQTDYDQIQALLRNIEMLYNTTMIELIYRNVLSQISLAE